MTKRRTDPEIRRPVVWVTGASRGIGKEIAKAFASIGCHVYISGRNSGLLSSVAKEIIHDGGFATAFRCDIRNPKSVATTVRQIRKKSGDIDVLINNAGVTVFKDFLSTTLADFDTIIHTNLLGQIACMKAVIPSMARRKQGWVINILSNAAVQTFEGATAYTATKAGLFGLTKVLREEMRKYNVKIVNVLPGATETEMWSAKARKIFSHRMMSAKSVAETVLAAYQTPDDVVVDELIIRPMLGDID